MAWRSIDSIKPMASHRWHGAAVSRSEAGQRKHLLVLDSNWQRTDEVLLDLGPRFHAMTGAEPVLPEDLRPGDR